MPDWERALVSRIAQTGSIDDTISAGIRPEHFLDEQAGQVFQFILDHSRTWNTTPSLGVITEKNPGYRFEFSTDSINYLLDGFTKQLKYRHGLDALKGLAAAINDEGEVGRIEEHFLDAGRHLSQLVPKSSVGRFSDMDERIAEYHRSRFEGSGRGIPFGIPAIDNSTMGIQPHEFISIVGWTGTGKSTLLQYFLFQAYLAGKTPLIFSMEMDRVDILQRWDTMAVNFSNQALRKYDLTDTEIEKWDTWAQKAREAQNDIIILDKIGRCTIDTVYAEIMRYNPDIVGVDYVSLMEPPRKGQLWEEVTALTRGLKVIAQSSGVPIFGVAQTNINSADGGAKLDNIAYSRSIAQDSDHVFGLHQDDEMKTNHVMELRHLKNRKGYTQDVPMYWNMNHMFFREGRPTDGFIPEQELVND